MGVLQVVIGGFCPATEYKIEGYRVSRLPPLFPGCLFSYTGFVLQLSPFSFEMIFSKLSVSCVFDRISSSLFTVSLLLVGGSWWSLLILRRLSLCKYKDILQADINASTPFLIACQAFQSALFCSVPSCSALTFSSN